MKTSSRSIEILEARIAPAAILNLENVELRLPGGGDSTVPGESVTVDYDVFNRGTSASTGSASFDFYLSTDSILDGSDKLLGTLSGVALNLKVGKNKHFIITVELPDLSLPNAEVPAGDKQIIIQTDFGDQGVTDSFPYLFKFGNVGNRKGVTLDVNPGTTKFNQFALSGAGTGELVDLGGTNRDLVFTGTDASSVATAKGTVSSSVDDQFGIRNITATSTMKALKMPALVVNGNVQFPGGIGEVVLDGITDRIGTKLEKTFTIGAGLGEPVKLKFRFLKDLDITSAVGIASLETGSWSDPDFGTDDLTAPFLNKLLVTKPYGNNNPTMQADVTLTGGAEKGPTLGTAVIDGILFGKWSVTGDIKSITADTATSFYLKSTGTVAKITVAKDWGDSFTGDPIIEAAVVGTVSVGGKFNGNSVKISGADAKGVGLKSFKVGNIEFLKEFLVLGGGIATLEAGNWAAVGGATDLQTQWIKSLKTTGATAPGDFTAKVKFTAPANTGVVLGKASIFGSIIGSASNAMMWLSANEGNSLGEIVAHGTKNFSVLINGPIDKVTIIGDVLGTPSTTQWDALTFGKFKVTGRFGGAIWTSDLSTIFEAITSFEAGIADAAEIFFRAGEIRKIDVGEWINGGFIRGAAGNGFNSPSIGVITTDGRAGTTGGDFTADLGYLRMSSNIKVRGALSGTWTAVAGNVYSLSARETLGSWNVSSEPDADVEFGSIKTVGNLGGNIKASGIGLLETKQSLTAAVDVKFVDTMGVPPNHNGEISKITAARISNPNLQAAHSIGPITADEWVGGSVKTSSIESVTIKGNKSKTATIPGDLSQVTFTFEQQPGVTGLSFLDTIKVAGAIINTEFRGAANTSFGSIKASEWNGGRIDGLDLGSLEITGSKSLGLRGDLAGVIVALTGTVRPKSPLDVTVAGVMLNSSLTMQSDADEIVLGAAIGSTIDIQNHSVRILKIGDDSGIAAPRFSETDIHIRAIGQVTIGDVAETASRNYGITADRIARYTRLVGDQVVKFEKLLEDPADGETVGNFQLTIL